MKNLDTEIEESLLPTTQSPTTQSPTTQPNIPPTEDSPIDNYPQAYASYTLNTFEIFERANSSFTNVDEITENSTEADHKKADAKLLHAMAVNLTLGINRIRSISDVLDMNKGIIDFIKARREILGHPTSKKDSGRGYLTPL